MDSDEISRFESIELSKFAYEDSLALRERFAALEGMIVDFTGPGRERSLALTALEEASHWAVRSIALTGRGQ